MKRLASGLLLAVVVTLAGAGLATLYGQSSALKLGDEATLAVAAMLIAAVTAVLLASIAWLVQAPARVAHARGDARRRARHEALSRGFLALGAGDTAQARRWAEAAEAGDAPAHPLSRLLAAWAAEADGDLKGATQAYAPLLDAPDSRLAALRGLMLIARRQGDEAGALAHAEAAFAHASCPAWAWRALFDAKLRHGDVAGAVALVQEGAARGVFPVAAGDRLRVLVQAGREVRVDPRAIDQALRG